MMPTAAPDGAASATQAPEPADVCWDNMSADIQHRNLRRGITLALTRWTEYAVSSRYLRNAYLMCFAAPFVFQLLFPAVQFVDIRGAQTTLCQDRLTKIQTIRNVARADESFRTDLISACSADPDDWATLVPAAFESAGLITSTGNTCSFMQTASYAALAPQAQSALRCINPETAASLIDGFAVAVSTEVLTASIGLRNGVNTLAALTPACLGIALGAGKGAMLAKVAVPGLRVSWPAFGSRAKPRQSC